MRHQWLRIVGGLAFIFLGCTASQIQNLSKGFKKPKKTQAEREVIKRRRTAAKAKRERGKEPGATARKAKAVPDKKPELPPLAKRYRVCAEDALVSPIDFHRSDVWDDYNWLSDTGPDVVKAVTTVLSQGNLAVGELAGKLSQIALEKGVDGVLLPDSYLIFKATGTERALFNTTTSEDTVRPTWTATVSNSSKCVLERGCARCITMTSRDLLSKRFDVILMDHDPEGLFNKSDTIATESNLKISERDLRRRQWVLGRRDFRGSNMSSRLTSNGGQVFYVKFTLTPL